MPGALTPDMARLKSGQTDVTTLWPRGYVHLGGGEAKEPLLLPLPFPVPVPVPDPVPLPLLLESVLFLSLKDTYVGYLPGSVFTPFTRKLRISAASA